MNTRVLRGILLLSLILLISEAFAGEKDIVLILDVSGSMNEEGKFQAVKSYLERDIFARVVGPGDRVTLVLFGNTPRKVFSEQIVEESDKQTLLERINMLKADDDYTDIGSALEYLFTLLPQTKEDTDTQNTQILFITDGSNTPPKSSPYYGKDLSVDERFRETGRKISQAGWFIYVIGIGKETDAQHIARAVPGSVLEETDTELSDVQIPEYLEKDSQAGPDTDSEANTGLAALIGRWAISLGLPKELLYGIFGLILLLCVLALAYGIGKLFRPLKVLVWDTNLDRSQAYSCSLRIWAKIPFNHPDRVLPSLGEKDHHVFTLSRSFKGVFLEIVDPDAVSDQSSYRMGGRHRLRKPALDLVNGERVLIQFE